MVRFINKISGQEMWVAEDRVEEYKAAGHKLAVFPSTIPEKPKAPKKKEKAKK